MSDDIHPLRSATPDDLRHSLAKTVAQPVGVFVPNVRRHREHIGRPRLDKRKRNFDVGVILREPGDYLAGGVASPACPERARNRLKHHDQGRIVALR